MLIAHDGQGQRTLAGEAIRRRPYACPACAAPVILKQGAIVIPHFAHTPRSRCWLTKGESLRHLEMKTQVGNWLQGSDRSFEFEVIFGVDRRADVVCQQMVVECQASALGIAEWEARTRFYNAAGYAVLWVWDWERVFPFDRDPDEDEVRVPAEIRHCHQMSYGRIAIMNGAGMIFDCHLSAIFRPPSDWDESTGYWPKSLRVPEYHLSKREIRVYRGPKGHRLIALDRGVWWKR